MADKSVKWSPVYRIWDSPLSTPWEHSWELELRAEDQNQPQSGATLNRRLSVTVLLAVQLWP